MINLTEKQNNLFRLVENDDYTLYELIDDDNIYIEECDVYGKKKYLVHNHKTNKSFGFINTLVKAKEKALNIWNN